MALPTHGRVLLDTTAGDIDIELWSKVRDATIIRACVNCIFAGSTEGMPEFHRVGHGRYAQPPLSSRMSFCANLTTRSHPPQKAIMTASSFIGKKDPFPPPLCVRSRLFSSLTRPLFLLSSFLYRVVPDFLVQTGDRTGTGAGGESFFGGTCATHYYIFPPRTTGGAATTEQFEDEIHPRLRFAHRGLVAMANSGAKNTNDSQFFITLGALVLHRHVLVKVNGYISWNGVDRADELHGKHTLFGRCVGDTIYSTSFMTSSFNLRRSSRARMQMS